MPRYATAESSLEPQLRDRAVEVAHSIWREHGFSERLDRFRRSLATERTGDLPTLHLDDVSGIPGVEDVPGVEEYQHRARIRAGDGDAVFTLGDPPSGYESYNRNYLMLGAPRYDSVGGEDPLACASACLEEENLREIRSWAERYERVAIEPFMAIEPVWRLASELNDGEVDVVVCGPPPPALWAANDKRRLADLCGRLFEDRRTPEWYASSEPTELADRLWQLAERYPRAALKTTRSASAMGNEVFESRELLEAGRSAVLERVRTFLADKNLDERDSPDEGNVLAVRWLDAEVSPSTQCWAPPEGEGHPYLDGFYEQLLVGGEGVFAGSRPSALPETLHRDLAETSLALLTVYQKLGYVGRCSFDFVVTGDPEGDYSVWVVDCNGRWGGASLPMQLVDRVVPGERPPYRAQDFVDEGLEGASFERIVEACRDELYRTETGDGRFILYNPGPVREHGKFDVVSMGRTREEAAEGIEEVLPDRLGL